MNNSIQFLGLRPLLCMSASREVQSEKTVGQGPNMEVSLCVLVGKQTRQWPVYGDFLRSINNDR